MEIQVYSILSDMFRMFPIKMSKSKRKQPSILCGRCCAGDLEGGWCGEGFAREGWEVKP